MDRTHYDQIQDHGTLSDDDIPSSVDFTRYVSADHHTADQESHVYCQEHWNHVLVAIGETVQVQLHKGVDEVIKRVAQERKNGSQQELRIGKETTVFQGSFILIAINIIISSSSSSSGRLLRLRTTYSAPIYVVSGREPT